MLFERPWLAMQRTLSGPSKRTQVMNPKRGSKTSRQASRLGYQFVWREPFHFMRGYPHWSQPADGGPPASLSPDTSRLEFPVTLRLVCSDRIGYWNMFRSIRGVRSTRRMHRSSTVYLAQIFITFSSKTGLIYQQRRSRCSSLRARWRHTVTEQTRGWS